jgi:hypothetical protein
MQLGCVFFFRQREGSAAVVGVGFGKRRVTFSLLLNSLLTLHSRELACRWSGQFFLGGRGSVAAMDAVVSRGEEESPFLSLCIYSPYKCVEVFGHWTKVVLIPLLGYLELVSITILFQDRPIQH